VAEPASRATAASAGIAGVSGAPAVIPGRDAIANFGARLRT